MTLDQEERPQLGPKMSWTHTQVRSACGGPAFEEVVIKGQNTLVK